MNFIFGFLLAIAFDPFTWTGATSLRWALLAAVMPLLCVFQSPKNFTFLHLLGLIFIAWATLTLIWTTNLWDGLGQLIQIGLLGVITLYTHRLRTLEPIFKGLALGIAISSLILLIPALKFPSIVLIYPHGLFGNRNMLCEVAVLTLLGLMVYRAWFPTPRS